MPTVIPPPLNRDVREGAYVARQPILNAGGKVFGYELLYRGAAADASCQEVHDIAAARVLNDAVLTLGLETLTGGKRAFINMTRHLLLSDFATVLPHNAVVLEVLENVAVDAEVTEACQRLRGLGYAIALDDYTPGGAADALLPFARYVKVDVLATTARDRQRMRDMLPSGIMLVADKVESGEMFEELRRESYQLFQGYYFCRPTTFAAGAMTARHIAYSRLLAALSRPDVTVAMVEDLIKHEASLTFRVLRCINSAAFAIRREIRSIRQALVLLGLDQVRKWALVWGLAGLNTGTTPELVTVAILRARSCELVGQDLMARDEAAEFFLLGLCSVLDAMLGRPMDKVIEELPLSETVRAALMGDQNTARLVLDAVIAYERGRWDEATDLALRAGTSPDRLGVAYAGALRWARELSQTAAAT
jgi:EAL and modified HD-GYP domain-containing signal transduction protein